MYSNNYTCLCIVIASHTPLAGVVLTPDNATVVINDGEFCFVVLCPERVPPAEKLSVHQVRFLGPFMIRTNESARSLIIK